jgi:hypothetical protein
MPSLRVTVTSLQDDGAQPAGALILMEDVQMATLPTSRAKAANPNQTLRG